MGDGRRAPARVGTAAAHGVRRTGCHQRLRHRQLARIPGGPTATGPVRRGARLIGGQRAHGAAANGGEPTRHGWWNPTVAQSDLPTHAPGSMHTSLRFEMEPRYDIWNRNQNT